jgi:ankyrin repeat protein
MFGYTALHAAAAAGQAYAASLLLQHGMPADETTDEGDTALHIATLHSHASIVQLLISAGADVDAADADGCTALHIAAEAGDTSIVRLLLDADADLDAADEGGETPLHLASEQGHLQVVQLLLEHCANPYVLCDGNGFTALHHAAAQGHISIANQLLEADSVSAAAAAGGAGPSHKPLVQQCHPGTSHMPLYEAVRYNQPVLVMRLLAALSAQPGFKAADLGPVLKLSVQHGSTACTELLLAAGALGSAGSTPAAALKAAYAAGDLDALRQLVQAGASPEVRVADSGKTLLHLAAAEGNVGMVRQLLAQGASLTAKDSAGCTPLHVAVQACNTRTVRVLLDAARAQGESVLAATVHAENRDGERALALAAAKDQRGIMQLLLDAGADVNAADLEGWTALLHAAYAGLSAAFLMLVRAGADVQAADCEGSTVLHKCMSANAGTFLQHALQAGAQCAATNKQRRTPLHAAAVVGNVEAIRLLLAAGAGVNAADADDNTPLHLAVRYDSALHRAAAEVLLAAGAAVEALNVDASTPLHVAARAGAAAAARLLLTVGGANPHAVDNNGTALYWAAKQGHAEMVRLLLERGATFDMHDGVAGQRSPFQEAVLNGRLEVVQLLLRWAPVGAAELRAAIVLGVSEAADAVGVVVYLLQQLAGADPDQLREVLQEAREFMEPTQVRRTGWLAGKRAGWADSRLPKSGSESMPHVCKFNPVGVGWVQDSPLWCTASTSGQYTHASCNLSDARADACLQVMFAMAQALHTSAASADAVSAAHAAEARDLAEQRLGLQSLITGLAAMQAGEQRKQQQSARQQAGDARQQRDQQEQGDVDMQDAGWAWDDWGDC